MKTDMKRLFADTSGAIAAVLLVFSFAVGGSNAVRAEDSESLALSAQDTVLIPVKDLAALEQRVRYLEETVTALTESWQHINTHRLCVSDDSGAEKGSGSERLAPLSAPASEAGLAEVTALRMERESIRGRVSDMLEQLEALYVRRCGSGE